MDKERIVPVVSPPGQTLRLLIDTDAANEIDDLYAVALALNAPDRFRLEGFVATHFAAKAGPESTGQSYDLLMRELRVAGRADGAPVARGCDPLQYPKTPTPGEGADLIIERARAGSPDDPLWVVGLGAATNLASAILAAPDIAPLVRFVFHARNEFNWPERTTQFNVFGDVIAVQELLACNAPLVWFDTGTTLTIPYEDTARRLAPLGDLGRFLHEYRDTNAHFASPEKGFFDMGDIAWLIDPGICQSETVEAPSMRKDCSFNHSRTHGPMLRAFEIRPEPAWELFFDRMESACAGV